MIFLRFLWVGLVSGTLLLARSGFDTGMGLVDNRDIFVSRGVTGREVEWVRIRAVAESGGEGDHPTRVLETDRQALRDLRASGVRTCVILRWGDEAWKTGFRVRQQGAGSRAPLDLREAFERTRRLAASYGDLVDAWEIDNEPDIGFFADNADVFAAYYKALALGLAAGRAEAGVAGGPPLSSQAKYTAPARILMAAPGLPPGPHFEQLLANGYLSYTEGFNYHHYGFAMDYAGVYASFQDAVAQFSKRSENRDYPARRLPVFLTEWGYSLLDGYEAQTVAGRVRQWAYFLDVTTLNHRLNVAAPMAFVAMPYFEHGMKEFGLIMPAADQRAAHYGFAVATREDAQGTSGKGYPAGGMVFQPEDFGATQPEPWMQRIGETGWRGEASPALAWLLAHATPEADSAAGLRWPLRKPAGAGQTGPAAAGAGDWTARTPAASPVVLDMAPGDDALAVKSYQGYWLRTPWGDDAWTGQAKLVLYNFAATEARIRFNWPQGLAPQQTDAGVFEATLAAGERREVPVRLSVSARVFAPSAVNLAAEVQFAGQPVVQTTYWASRFYPWPKGLAAKDVKDFTAFSAQDAAENRARLLSRPLAPEEPALVEQGRWLVTPGVRVEDTPNGWRIHLDRQPGVGARPAVAELPLPKDWRMPVGTMLSYDYCLTPLEGAQELRSDSTDAGLRPLGGRFGDMAESYIRTENGNLFSTVPRLVPTAKWQRYNQNAENLTLHFLGRTAPPWRFLDNRPAALVFFIRPKQLPAVFEVREPSLSAWAK